MKIFEFTITIDQYVEDLAVIDAFYGKTGDAAVAGSEGKTSIHFDREAKSLDDALRSAVGDVQAEGWQVREISVEPDCVLPLSTA
ncbi:MAG: hypothetical protein WBF93_03050 [Pirellulales bacterium]|nr:hypothetical protein [Pirellulales bacterium]